MAIKRDTCLDLKARLYSGTEIAMGPGKADLLMAIADTGSISAAGRSLGMSYRRTWLLVDTMNRCWSSPLVETAAGGPRGGGARLSDLGVRVLAGYRSLQDRIGRAALQGDWADLSAEVRPEPKTSQKIGTAV